MVRFSFCPNKSCDLHNKAPKGPWYSSCGEYKTKAFGSVPRFICSHCKRTFSTQTFSIHYYAKKLVNLEEVLARHSESQSGRAIGRAMGISPDSVQNRLDRLSRQALAAHSILRAHANPHESVCIDGFVSFDQSQYFPNEITISITSQSQFVFEFSHATRKRSGTMTSRQAARAHELYSQTQCELGGIKRSFRDNLDTIAEFRPPSFLDPLILVTDEKPEYRQVLYEHPLFLGQDDTHRVAHIRVWSKLPRTYMNPLFASNYLDREIRKDQANHHRETVCFTRNVANGLARLACYVGYHNYFKRFRIKAPVWDMRTHAEVAGIDFKALRKVLKNFFKKRAFISKTKLSVPLEKAWKKTASTPLKDKVDYLPSYALA